MIPRRTPRPTSNLRPHRLPRWRRLLAEAVSDPVELCALLDLSPEDVGLAAKDAGFPLRVPRGFVDRMEAGNPRDPLLLQVLPVRREHHAAPGYGQDPLAEIGSGPAPGVLHKYRHRALLTLTGACAVHCRYCFRRHFPYVEHGIGRAAWKEAVAYLAGDPSIHEVILSGGDPLSLPDERLADLAEELAAIPHLQRLRVHTRLPVVLPERVDDALLDWLAGADRRLQPVVVIHANHPREIDDEVSQALQGVRQRGITLLNQSVLLRGVNDHTDTLSELSERLFESGVLPYYLHLLDPVDGAAHFDVPEAEGQGLVAAMAARLPGYLVPRLVREVPGARTKVPVDLHRAFLQES
ncbi:MAG: EF-P beta-lysylation protein EpmB [Acidobacteriota bacterium]